MQQTSLPPPSSSSLSSQPYLLCDQCHQWHSIPAKIPRTDETANETRKKLKRESKTDLLLQLLFATVIMDCRSKKQKLTADQFAKLQGISYFNFNDLATLMGVNKLSHKLGAIAIPMLAIEHRQKLATHATDIGHAPLLKVLLPLGFKGNCFVYHAKQCPAPCAPGTLLERAQRQGHENIVRLLSNFATKQNQPQSNTG